MLCHPDGQLCSISLQSTVYDWCVYEIAYLDTSWINPTRSSSFSPNPRIPPEQTEIPAARTASMVARRSSYERVLMTFACQLAPSYYATLSPSTRERELTSG